MARQDPASIHYLPPWTTIAGVDLPVPDEWLCTVDQVLTLLQSVDPSKASGPDGISARMLQSTAASIAPAIMKLFNLSLRSGIFPSVWKIAQVTPVPKSSQTSDPSQYLYLASSWKSMSIHIYSSTYTSGH